MLANPATSKVVLIDVFRQASDLPPSLVAHLRKQLLMLAEGFKLFGHVPVVMGEFEESLPFADIAATIKPNDPPTGRNEVLLSTIAAETTTTFYIGGSWLEEEILLTAVEGVALGYDVRVIADISLARREADRVIAFDRFAQHGILPATVGQLLLEWATALGDSEVRRKVRLLLS